MLISQKHRHARGKVKPNELPETAPVTALCGWISTRLYNGLLKTCQNVGEVISFLSDDGRISNAGRERHAEALDLLMDGRVAPKVKLAGQEVEDDNYEVKKFQKQLKQLEIYTCVLERIVYQYVDPMAVSDADAVIVMSIGRKPQAQ
jgi:hypothetical protein